MTQHGHVAIFPCVFKINAINNVVWQHEITTYSPNIQCGHDFRPRSDRASITANIAVRLTAVDEMTAEQMWNPWADGTCSVAVPVVNQEFTGCEGVFTSLSAGQSKIGYVIFCARS